MKSIMSTLRFSFVLTIVIVAVSCGSSKHSTVTVSSGTAGKSNLPPGQAKKLNGDQSAKEYAPGQQKKKNK